MKIFTEKKVIQKIIIAIIFVTLFNFIVPNICFADEPESGVLGVLFKPIKDLLLGATDAVVWVMNKTIYGMDETFIDLEYNKPKDGILRKA